MDWDIGNILEAAPETKCVEIGRGALKRVPSVLSRFFPKCPVLVIADSTTFEVAGRKVLKVVRKSGHESGAVLFKGRGFYAEEQYVLEVEKRLRERENAVGVAVGSGTINDVTKLAAHRVGRRYLSVATAASMDGYTAFGASITRQGSKQTFGCPAPLAVIADVDILRAAPGELTSAGYADLLAKITAGADWLLADALGVEALHDKAWELAQGNLRSALSRPALVRRRKTGAIQQLTEGLLLTGFAMQFAGSSRPASGAEHQFSHLWDMEDHQHAGAPVLHGHKVGIGTLAAASLYEYLMEQRLEQLRIEACRDAWPAWGQMEKRVRALFGEGALAEVALRESRAKYVDSTELENQLVNLRRDWPELRRRLRAQLLPVSELKQWLAAAGAPTEPEQIGLSRERLRQSFWKAYCIRRRFTILDVAVRTGLLDPALAAIFG